jgi:uncharacterized protein (TIGR03067 family)
VRTTLVTAISLVALFAFGSGFAAPVPKEDPVKAELNKLNGLWKVTSMQKAGVELVQEDSAEQLLTFKNGEFTWGDASEPFGKILSIDPSRSPREVDYTYNHGPDKDKRHKAIYSLDGDTFMDCFGEAEGDRPTEFKSTADNGYTLVKYKRVKKKED